MISTGTLSKLENCGLSLTLGNFSVFSKMVMLKHSYLHPIDEDKLHGNIIAKTIKNIYKLIIQIKHEIYLKDSSSPEFVV